MKYRTFLLSIFFILSISTFTSASDAGITVGPFSKNYDMCCFDNPPQTEDEEIRLPQEFNFPLEELADQLLVHMQNRTTPFTVDISKSASHTQSELKDAFAAAILLAYKEDEELRYDVRGYTYRFTYWDNRVIYEVTPRYGQTKEQVDFVNDAVKKLVPQLITPQMNDHEKVKAIHDYIILNTEYDLSMDQTYNNPFYALTRQKTLCGGYSRLAALMLREAGLNARVISGYSSNGVSSKPVAHAWNLVEVDGEWYHLDITWDDPIFPSTQFQPTYIQYDYFLLPDEAMRTTHQWQEGGLNKFDTPYPKANTYYETFMLNRGETEWLDQLQFAYEKIDDPMDIHSILQNAIKRGASSVKVLYPMDIKQTEVQREINLFHQAHSSPVQSMTFQSKVARQPNYKIATVYFNTAPTVKTIGLQWAQPLQSEYALHSFAPFRLQALLSDGSTKDVTLQSSFFLSGQPSSYHLGNYLYFNQLGKTTVDVYHDDHHLRHTFEVVPEEDIQSTPERPIEPESPILPYEEYEPLLEEDEMPLQAHDANKVWTLYLNESLSTLQPNAIEVVDEHAQPKEVHVAIGPSNQVTITPLQPYELDTIYYIFIHQLTNEKEQHIQHQYVTFSIPSSQ